MPSVRRSTRHDLRIRRTSDAQIVAMQVPSTPTIVVNGKYRLTVQSAGGVNAMFDLVKFLVAKEGGR